ncbi:YwiB family protein [Lactovum odontotermitis]
MKLLISSQIEINGQTETVSENYECELTERSGKTYLTFVNPLGDKMLIKFNENELTRIQFGENPLTMRFIKNQLTSFSHELLGLIMIDTKVYEVSENRLRLDYQLLQNEVPIGNYQLEISYGMDETGAEVSERNEN